jgi:hypothetical protein
MKPSYRIVRFRHGWTFRARRPSPGFDSRAKLLSMFKDAAEHDSVSRSITRAHYQTREPWMMEPVRTLTLERFGKSGD